MASKFNSFSTESGFLRPMLLFGDNISKGNVASKSTFNLQIRTYIYRTSQNTVPTPAAIRRHEVNQKYGPSQQTPTKSSIEAMRDGINALDKNNRAAQLEHFQHRRWTEGDAYAPHDLSWVEMKKWKEKHPSKIDVFDALAINPLNEYKNIAMMWEYCTTMGRIRHRKETGLRPVNQRRISKAIRRAVSMGLMPSVHKHPEMLEAEAVINNRRHAKINSP